MANGRQQHKATKRKPLRNGDSEGFTLLELMVMLTIMILLAAMVYPAMGLLNDKERRRITEERMEEIRRAIVGDPDRFDDAGRRIIGGYVGDMEAWPDLWEAPPQVKEGVIGTPPAFNTTDPNNPNIYYYRPFGKFGEKSQRWKWEPQSLHYLPFRKLTDDTANNSDHIGGLETENEGQPLGLWTDDPSGEDLHRLDDKRWKGPYLITPKDSKLEDAEHYATTDGEYYDLAPAYGTGPVESWEDGDYAPTDLDPGEYFDEKEKFRLLQTDGRLEDGWNRSLRFFITRDPDHANGTILWIISEGPDHEGTYPNKGNCAMASWTPDPDDRMGYKYDKDAPAPKGYNPDDKYNEDNIVMKIYSHEWQAVFDELNQRRLQQTEEQFTVIRRALIGESAEVNGGFNSGFTGALCRWPALFRWEDNGTPAILTDDFWDDKNEDATPVAYTKGQPRGLWTNKPNSADTSDNLLSPSVGSPGIGWSGAFLPTPMNTGADEKLVDAWGREVLFFRDAAHDSLLLLSRGPDGRFDFLDTDTLPAGAPDGTDDYLEPGLPTEAVDVTTYTPADTNGYNADNVVMVIGAASWKPAWFTLEQFTVNNATVGTTKAMLVYGWNSTTGLPLTTTPYSADASPWIKGGAHPAEAFLFNDSTVAACTGTRALVTWNDTDNDNAVDTGESWHVIHYNLYTHNGHEPRTNFTIDTATHFSAAP